MPERPAFDPRIPHPARVWACLIDEGGEYYESDREAAEEYKKSFPGIVAFARASRGFYSRALNYLLELQHDQFIDLGCGLPTRDNTHQRVQRVRPAGRVLYADVDPVVGLKRDALSSSTAEGSTDYAHVDMRDTDQVLAHAKTVLNLNRPVALLLSDCMGHLDYEEALEIVGRLTDALPSGSHLMLSHASDLDEVQRVAQEQYNAIPGGIPYHLRSVEKIAGLFDFDHLEMEPPGLMPWADWRPDETTNSVRTGYGAVARIR
ncbi:SAM-dependent methyltransferase [Streptomyces niveus]|uniref:SAM-dependent methyltransferase n=1 Tax=Streptomyces niveus TaxID=193462 RepID=UPI0036887BAB